jgi:CheY-like chemotaxis protein
MELRPEVYPVKAVLQGVVESVRVAAEGVGISFTIEVPDSIAERFVHGDKLRMQQVMLNLLSNAVKYTPAGGSVSYSLAVLDPPQDGCNVEMRVSDTGAGMSEEFQKKMYDPFSQERTGGRAMAQGTGLGLSIVKRIVDLMGGTIAVQSALGEGTTFIVHLPVEFVEPMESEVRELHDSDGESVPEPDVRRAAAALRGLHVLLVEDNEVNAEVAKAMLEKHLGALVDVVADGKQGVDAFAASPIGSFDAILMDVRMPVMNGMDATRAIRALDRDDAAGVPILAMTADVFADDIKACKAAGMNGHIGKPIDVDRLLFTLGELVEREDD